MTATYRSDGPGVSRLRHLALGADLVRVDLARESDFSALPKTADAIVHIAGVSLAPGIALDEMLACNVAGTRNLLNYARHAGVSRIVLTSTLSVHGDVEEKVVTETTPIRSPDVYGASKYLAERIFAAESHWLPCTAIRLPGVLGEGAHRAWLPSLLERIRCHQDVNVYNLHSTFNNAAHVQDVSNLILNLLGRRWSGFHAFPIGAAGTMSISDLVGLMISLTGSQSNVGEGHAQKNSFMVSSEYAAKTFQYNPMNIEVMLRRYVDETS